MRSIYKKIAIVLAAVIILTGVSGCGALTIGSIAALGIAGMGGNEDVTVETTSPAYEPDTATETETSTQAENETVAKTENPLLPTYEHYDPTEFMAGCEELEKLGEAGEVEKMNELYDSLYAEAIRINDIYNMSEVLAYENASDEKAKEENEYTHDVTVDCNDRLSIACLKLITGKSAKEFKEHLNDDYLIEYYETYEESSDRLKEITSEETKLVNEYNTIMDNMGDITCEVNGQTYKFGDLLDYENSQLYLNDYNTFYEAFNKCYKTLNEQAGAIFVKLVKIRDEIAKEHGFDNYNDYADEKIYGRDYSESDLEKMKAAVREFGYDYRDTLYAMMDLLPKMDTSAEALVADGKLCLEGISPLSDKAMKFFEENKLYSIGNEKNRVSAGFTTTFAKDNIPFIFIKTDNNAYDVITFTHEFGHFTDAYWNANPYPLFMTGSYDLFETHSTGLQLLAGANYENVFGEDAQYVDSYNAIYLLTYVSDGCLYDEWQREIYKNPDMTLDEINQLFKDISEDYGAPYYDGMEYSWVEVNHNFSSPLYYASYATSAFVSLQIWLESLEDYSGAIALWENIVGSGAYEAGYMDVVEKAGLKTFNNTKDVADVLNNVYDKTIGSLFNYGDY